MKKWSISLVIGSLLFSLTGCWDKVEINDRAFAMAMGIDKFVHEEIVEGSKKAREEDEPKEEEEAQGAAGEEAEAQQQQQPKEEEPPKKREDEKELQGEDVVGIERPRDIPQNRYTISYSIPNLGKMKEALDIGGEDIKFVRSIVAETPFDGAREIGTRVPKKLYYGHTKAIILGKEMAEDEVLMKETLGWLERDHEIDRRIYVLVADGKAQDIVKNLITIDPFLGIYIREVFDNRKNVARFRYMDLDQLIQAFRKTGDAILPRIVLAKEENKIAGAAVFRNFKYVGWLSEEETRATLWVDDEIKGGTITVRDQDIYVPYEISDARTDLQITEKPNGQLLLQIDIHSEGNINSYVYGAKRQLMDDAHLNQLEQKIGNKISSEVKNTVEKLQKQFKVDALGFKDYIEKERPDLWERIKGDWEEKYETMEVQVNPNIAVRRIGVSK